MNKHIHNSILHLAKAVLCMTMLFLLFMLSIVATYSILALGIILFIVILIGMLFGQLGYFIGYVIKANRK